MVDKNDVVNRWKAHFEKLLNEEHQVGQDIGDKDVERGDVSYKEIELPRYPRRKNSNKIRKGLIKGRLKHLMESRTGWKQY